MDLVRVQTPGRMFYSFLSITWGVVADVDLESEKYRHLGGARFTVGALKRILSMYIFSYVPLYDIVGMFVFLFYDYGLCFSPYQIS